MAKRKRYTIRQLRELEAAWRVRVVRAARKLDEYSKRLERALRTEEKTRGPTKTLDQVMRTPEPSPAYERTVDVLTVPCMTCDVGAGAECLSKGKKVDPHKSRVAAATGKAVRA